MAPKNKKKNSFYFFMKELQEKEAAKGRRIAISDMSTYAHPIWAKMSLAEREPYEKMARLYKNDPCVRGPKLASDGTSVEANRREIEESERKQRQMKIDIQSYISRYASEEEYKENIPKTPLYFISFNILCKTEKEYIPIELGLVEYTISHGLQRELHTIINTGAIPTGYTGDARRISEDKHEIDIFTGPEGSVRDMRAVYESIKSFINPTNDDSYLPMFCGEDTIELTTGCLNFLKLRARDPEELRVWNATYLLLELRSGLGSAYMLPPTIATDMLSKTSFNYHPDARCSYHDDKDNNNCALAYSKRLCYLLSDAVCEAFDVPLTEKHMPTRAVEEKDYVVVAPRGPAKEYHAPTASRGRLDERDNYYDSEADGQFDDLQSAAPPRATPRPPKPAAAAAAVRRQPASECLAEATRLRLHIGNAPAAAPGHGIGRGQRRQ